MGPGPAAAAVMTPDFRRARSCDRHLAGEREVAVLDDLLARSGVCRARRDYVLTRRGHLELTRRGVVVAPAMRGRRCRDLPLAGPLGRALLEALLAQGRMVRRRGHRALGVRRRLL